MKRITKNNKSSTAAKNNSIISNRSSRSQNNNSPSNGVLGCHAVGRRLALVKRKADSREQHECGTVVAYYPKTRKHRVKFDRDNDGIVSNNNKTKNNLLLLDSPKVNFYWLPSVSTTTANNVLSPLELAIQRDAVGRRLELFQDVRKTWSQGTVLKYIEHCHQHTVEVTEEGGNDDDDTGDDDDKKVQLFDLGVTRWRYIDLRGPLDIIVSGNTTTRDCQDLATSKYMGVVRYTVSAWKCHFTPNTSNKTNNKKYLHMGLFSSEKDAALAYDLWARRDKAPVNFSDRRISKSVLESLRIPEPPAPVVNAAAAVNANVRSVSIGSNDTNNDSRNQSGKHDAVNNNIDFCRTTPSLVEAEDTSASGSWREDQRVGRDLAFVATGAQMTCPTKLTTAPITSASSGDGDDNENDLQRGDCMSGAATLSVSSGRIKADTPKVLKESKADLEPKKARADPLVRIAVMIATDEKATEPSSLDEDLVLSKLADEPRIGPAKHIGDASDEESELEDDAVVSARRTGKKGTRRTRFIDEDEEDSTTTTAEDVFSSSDESDSPQVPSRKKTKAKTQQREKKHNIFYSTSDDEAEKTKNKPLKKSKQSRKKARKESQARRAAKEEDNGSTGDESVGPSMSHIKKAKNSKKGGKVAASTSTPRRQTSPHPATSAVEKPRVPRYPVGTRFVKEFPDFGTYNGKITAFDGKHYHVYYSADEDEEELSEFEFEGFVILPARKRGRPTRKSG